MPAIDNRNRGTSDQLGQIEQTAGDLLKDTKNMGAPPSAAEQRRYNAKAAY